MAVSGINTSGISVGSDGKLKVSGFSSGIDWKNLIDTQMTAKRAPAIQLETKITTNKTLISAYGDLKTKVESVVSSLDALRTSPTSADADVFRKKTVSGGTTAAAGAPVGFTPSSVDSLLLASVDPSAQNATHTIKIKQLAQAHQLGSGSFSSASATLVSQGVAAGTISIGGQNIQITATDTLADLKAKINNVDTGVTATIVSASSSSHYLVLTATDTGEDNAIALGGAGATLDSLGLTSAGGTVIANELKEAKNAIIDVDGIEDIERQTNEIDDVISGVTLSLIKSEEHTEITLKVEPDLASVKSAINDFVVAYNDLRSFAAAQRTASDRNNDGIVDDDELGPLAYNQALRDVLAKMSDIASANVDSAADGFKSLSQIGVVMNKDYTLKLDDSVLDNKLLTGVNDIKQLFGFSTTVSDSRVTVLGRQETTQAGTYYLNVGPIGAGGLITSANLQTQAGVGLGGATDGTLVLNAGGTSVTASSSSPAEGLSLYFNGVEGPGVDGVTVTVNRGLADLFYDDFYDFTKDALGQLDVMVTDLQDQNETYKNRVDTIDARLEVSRKALETKYTNMETALAKLTSLQSTIDSYFNAENNKSNN